MHLTLSLLCVSMFVRTCVQNDWLCTLPSEVLTPHTLACEHIKYTHTQTHTHTPFDSLNRPHIGVSSAICCLRVWMCRDAAAKMWVCSYETGHKDCTSDEGCTYTYGGASVCLGYVLVSFWYAGCFCGCGCGGTCQHVNEHLCERGMSLISADCMIHPAFYVFQTEFFRVLIWKTSSISVSL